MRGFVLVALLAALAEGSLSTQRGRAFKGGAQDFRAISRDGQLLLAAGTRPCAGEKQPLCRVAVLTIYRTADARTAAELEGPQNDYFYGGAFTADGLVTATTLHASLRWSPATSKTEWEPLPPRGAGRTTGATPRDAVAPDGSIAMTVRAEIPPRNIGDPDDPTVHGPDVTIWLDVFSGPDRAAVRHLRLLCPERPTRTASLLRPAHPYWTGARMTAQFAEAIALSPDGRWVAIGYGVRFGDTWGDVQARIAIFSLADGHRAGTIDGARYRRNIVIEALTGGDGGPTEGVPLGERIAFSADSQTLYGTSLKLFGVDVSRLR
jgi:hypothetical protein